MKASMNVLRLAVVGLALFLFFISQRDMYATPTHYILLQWKAPKKSIVNGKTIVTGYNIYRGQSNNFAWLAFVNPQFRSYKDTGILSGQVYQYKVTAMDNKVEGPPSSTVSIAAK